MTSFELASFELALHSIVAELPQRPCLVAQHARATMVAATARAGGADCWIATLALPAMPNHDIRYRLWWVVCQRGEPVTTRVLLPAESSRTISIKLFTPDPLRYFPRLQP